MKNPFSHLFVYNCIHKQVLLVGGERVDSKSDQEEKNIEDDVELD